MVSARKRRPRDAAATQGRRTPNGRRRKNPTAESLFPTPKAIVPNIVAGTLAGLITALGGALKDTPYEGFKPKTFYRSIWVGALAGALTSTFTDSFWIAFMCSGYLERGAVEGWKIVRAQIPGKFIHGSAGHTGPVALLPSSPAADRRRPPAPPSSAAAELAPAPARVKLPEWEAA